MFSFGENRLTASKAIQIASGQEMAGFSDDTRVKIRNSSALVQRIATGNSTVYGINTGFGPLCDTKISSIDTLRLQENILRSHSVGVGQPVPEIISKLMLTTKLQALSVGYSGITEQVMERLLLFLQQGITPVVPSQGSVGASGDLAPLAHLCLPLIGLGEVYFRQQQITTQEVYFQLGLEPLTLQAKEGLALINGTQFILSYAVHGLERMFNALEVADIIGAMSLEGMLGSVAPFDQRLHEIRPFSGAKYVAENLRNLLEGSQMVASHADCGRVQDPYSLRCMPQVHGASRQAWLHLKELVEIELNAVTDNPIVLGEDETISGGNFHGQPLALPLDYAALAAAELGNISDRRTYLLLEGKVGLPRLLMKNTGINSGFMIPQYTSAALVSENKSLVWPASADSIPTSLGQEDHVSMGSISARKLHMILDNLEYILAVELVCAAQAFDFRRPLKSGSILDSIHTLVRSHIAHAEEDRIFAEDIQKAHGLIKSKELTQLKLNQSKPESIFSF